MKYMSGHKAHSIRNTIEKAKNIAQPTVTNGFELTRVQSFVDGSDSMFDLLATKKQDLPSDTIVNTKVASKHPTESSFALKNFADSLASALKFITRNTTKIENTSHYVFRKETAPQTPEDLLDPAQTLNILKDPLTGFLNRKGFLKFYAREMKRLSVSQSNQSGTLVIIDIENYEFLLKKYGIASAQKAIFMASKMLAKDLQNLDFVARIHDDQFIVTLPNTPKAAAVERVQRLAFRLNNLSFISAGEELSLHTGIRMKSYRANGPKTQHLTDSIPEKLA